MGNANNVMHVYNILDMSKAYLVLNYYINMYINLVNLVNFYYRSCHVQCTLCIYVQFGSNILRVRLISLKFYLQCNNILLLFLKNEQRTHKRNQEESSG